MLMRCPATRGWLLIQLLLIHTFTSAAPLPRPIPGLFQDLGSQLGTEIGEVIDTGIATIISLVKALKSGQTTQNGLLGDGTMIISGTAGVNGTTANFTADARVATDNCPEVAVLFARGTLEPGNMGFLAGPPFTTALKAYTNNSRVAFQGVDYDADVKGFREGGDPFGSFAMAVLTNTTINVCPNAKIVLSGYSQGAQVVRKATEKLGPSARNVDSVVLFGDPKNGTAVANVPAERVMVICHDGDDICKGGSQVLPAHLNYSSDAPAAAMFVMQNTGLGLASQDAMDQGMGNIPMMKMGANGAKGTDGLAGQAVMDLGSGDAGKGGGFMGALGLG